MTNEEKELVVLAAMAGIKIEGKLDFHLSCQHGACRRPSKGRLFLSPQDYIIHNKRTATIAQPCKVHIKNYIDRGWIEL